MMKWEVKTGTTNIGILELGNLTFNEDCMEIFIDICNISDNLRAKVDKTVEIAKVKYAKKREADNKKYGTNWNTTWSDKPVIMDFIYLSAGLEVGKPISYHICIGFHDATHKDMEQWDCAIAVDLSEYESELKKAIIKALVDKFF